MIKMRRFAQVVTAMTLSFSSMAALADVFTLKVMASGGKYFFDGERTPVVNLEVGDTVIFDLSDSSLRAHPFYITEQKDSRRFYTGAFRDPSSQELRLEVTEETPKQLFYSCTRHRGMGGDGFIAVAE